ncbi:MAG: ATP-dependent Clp protease ATP-binding subunit [bacterium]
MLSITEKFNNHALEALKNAIYTAVADKNELLPKHILISIANQKGSAASHLLKNLVKNDEKSSIKNTLSNLDLNNFKISDDAHRVLEKAILVAATNCHIYIGTEHLLAGLLEISDPSILEIFKLSKINIIFLKQKLHSIFESISNFPAFYPLNADIKTLSDRENIKLKTRQKNKSLYLSNFCADLTDELLQKDIDPVIGRDKEIERIIQILSRRNKNNPILIGEAGVGKTAIVEGLAKKIFKNNVPPPILNKKIFSLDINALIAGTTFRGEFEGRLKNILNELMENDDIIVFIDEIHNIIGAGSASGTMDAANILKPALARGNIRFIGATTLDEYKKHIERDPALERRFQPIIIREPSIAQAKEMIVGIRNNYEKFHNLNISEEAIEEAVRLSSRYMRDRLLPDKAIDLLDEAASKHKLRTKSKSVEHKIKELEQKLSNAIKEKEKYLMEEKFDEASTIKKEEGKTLSRILKLKKSEETIKRLGEIGKSDILKTLSEIVNIPEQDIKNTNVAASLKKIKTKLENNIIAQNEATDKITSVLKRSLAGISSPNRPLGSFLFLGPSGVGKTETAKVLAAALFNNKNSLVRIDMSEYAESFNLSKLIGAPAGYVGFDQGGILTEKIRKNPYSIILFDELEKAHKSFFNLLLEILEEGEITDASGRVINFKNTIIIMTSNIGLKQLDKKAEIGFSITDKKEKENFDKKYEKIKTEIMNELSNILPIEFINRVDEIIFFKNLSLNDIKKIAENHLKKMAERLKEKNLILSYTKNLPDFLAKKSICRKQGARLVRKTIQTDIENILAEKIIAGEIKEGDTFKVAEKEGKIIISNKMAN